MSGYYLDGLSDYEELVWVTHWRWCDWPCDECLCL